ncbi:MAG: hypothetical protein ACREIV_05045, partial [Planctomycetaceae bacterium]
MRSILGLCALAFASSAFAAEFPGERWPEAKPEDAGLDRALLEQARDYALTGGGSGLVIHRGKAVIAWGDQTKRYDLKSTT